MAAIAVTITNNISLCRIITKVNAKCKQNGILTLFHDHVNCTYYVHLSHAAS